ncbi:MAG: hypothetical protein U0Q22_04030 [Acidimicrobiales bacterium]
MTSQVPIDDVATLISAAARKAFANVEKDDLRHYQAMVLEAINNVRSRMARVSGLILIVVAVFELLAHDGTASINVGPLSAHRSDVVMLGFPPVLAYFWLEMIILSNQSLVLLRTHTAVFELWNSSAARWKFERCLEPPQPLYFSTGGLAPGSAKSEWSIRLGLFVIYFLGAPAYLVRMFLQLFDHVPASNPFLWASLAVACGLFLLGGWSMIENPRQVVDLTQAADKPEPTEPADG